MPVLRYLMAVGVSGAIVFFNIGGGEAVPPTAKGVDGVSESHSTRESGAKQNSTKFRASGNAETELSEHPTPVASQKASDLNPSKLAGSDSAENAAISVQKPAVKSVADPATAPSPPGAAPPSVAVAVGDNLSGEEPASPAPLALVDEFVPEVPDLTPPAPPRPQADSAPKPPSQ
ncbi:hypothetical protein LKE08_15260, partial [Lyngbya sp. CCY1209]|nr:hypothetical protein [Lyngbya sp. CCY1209]